MTNRNLATDPWCPVLGLDNKARTTSFRDLFANAHDLARLAVSTPPGESTLLRVLVAIAYKVSGLNDRSLSLIDWRERRNDLLHVGRFDATAVDAYFDQWGHRFDLFDADRPWMQDPRLAQECTGTPAGVNKIVMWRAAGNNFTWFGPFHRGHAAPLPISEAVEYLLANAYYGPSGTGSNRALPGQKPSKMMAAGPLRGTISYHPTGANLFETLLLGMVPPHQYGPENADPALDLTPWEADLPDPARAKPLPAGIRQILTGQANHALLLVPDAAGQMVTDAYMAWQYAKAQGSDAPVSRDPYLSWSVPAPKVDVRSRKASAARALWRDLDALVAEPDDVVDGKPRTWERPAAIAAIGTAPFDVQRRTRVTGHAFDQDGKTVDRAWFTALTPAVFLDDSDDLTGVELTSQQREELARHSAAFREGVIRWVHEAEAAHVHLRVALIRARVEALDLLHNNSDRFTWAEVAEPIYWARAAEVFNEAVNRSGSDGMALNASSKAAAATLRNLVRSIYDQVTETATDPRRLRAVMRHRPHRLRAVSAAEPAATDQDTTATDVEEISA